MFATGHPIWQLMIPALMRKKANNSVKLNLFTYLADFFFSKNVHLRKRPVACVVT